MAHLTAARFANASLTDSLTVPCPCPGTPHDEDTIVHRAELGAGEEARAGVAGWASTGGSYFDWEVARDKLIEIGTVRWTFLDADGTPVPISMQNASRLPEDIRNAIAERLDKAAETARGTVPLPKRRGGRSPRGSRGGASRTPTTTTPTPA